jgi:hypothetical protein
MAVVRLYCCSQNLSHRPRENASPGNDGGRVPASLFQDRNCIGRRLVFCKQGICPTATPRKRQVILRALGGLGSRDHHDHSMLRGHALPARRRSHHRISKAARKNGCLAACLERIPDRRCDHRLQLRLGEFHGMPTRNQAAIRDLFKVTALATTCRPCPRSSQMASRRSCASMKARAS